MVRAAVARVVEACGGVVAVRAWAEVRGGAAARAGKDGGVVAVRAQRMDGCGWAAVVRAATGGPRPVEDVVTPCGQG